MEQNYKFKLLGACALLFAGTLLTGCSGLTQAVKTAQRLAETGTELAVGAGSKAGLGTGAGSGPDPIFEIEAWGEVKYNREYQINIDFPAQVESVEIEMGERIQKGDLLAVLDLTEFNNAIAKLESQKVAGESALSSAYQDPSGLEARIAQAEKDIAIARRDVNNNQALFDGGVIARDALDQYISALSNSETNLRVLQVELAQINKSNVSNVDFRASEVYAAAKDLQTYENKRDQEFLKGDALVCNLDHAIVKSVHMKEGALLGELNPTAVELIDLGSIYISAEVEEEFIKYISKDSSVRIVPTMDTEKELVGQVKQIAAMAVEKDGNRIVEVQVIAEDPEQLLWPGYTADVYFE